MTDSFITNEMFYGDCNDPCTDPEHGLLHCEDCGSRPRPGWLCVSCTQDTVGYLIEHGSDDEQLAWYRATFDDDQADDDLVLTRLAAWAAGQSLGPFVHGIPLRDGAPAGPPLYVDYVSEPLHAGQLN